MDSALFMDLTNETSPRNPSGSHDPFVNRLSPGLLFVSLVPNCQQGNHHINTIKLVFYLWKNLH